MQHLSTRHIVLLADNAGSASGTIGVGPSRYAATYYVFTPDTASCNIDIENLGRSVFSKTGAHKADGIQELAPTAEKVVDGLLVASIAGASAGDEIELVVFLHR